MQGRGRHALGFRGLERADPVVTIGIVATGNDHQRDGELTAFQACIKRNPMIFLRGKFIVP